MRLIRNLAVVAVLTLVALVTLAPRLCPSCGYEKLKTDFEEQAFIMEIVSLRVDRESGDLMGSADIVPVVRGDIFRSAVFALRFRGEIDRNTGAITGKGKFELKSDPDDVIIDASGTLSFRGTRVLNETFEVVASGRVNIVEAELRGDK